MSKVSEVIRSHHRKLVSTLTERVVALVEGRPGRRLYPDA